MSDNVINFYKIGDAYGYFSNFAHYATEVDGKLWPTTEHYFQAMKFPDQPDTQEAIRADDNPMKAFKAGRGPGRRPDWEEVKEGFMEAALYAKFTQHEYLKGCILGTGDAKLIEHTKNDSYWGDGGDGKGKNRLGELLMKVRDRIRKEEEST